MPRGFAASVLSCFTNSPSLPGLAQTLVVVSLLYVQRECFSVKHYAGTVKYTVEGWVDRNMDSIPVAFAASLGTSGHKVRPEKRRGE